MNEPLGFELEIKTTDEYAELSKREKEALVGSTVYAYTDTNIDGYGDEGEGYDGEVFVQNLLAMGWTFNGVIETT